MSSMAELAVQLARNGGRAFPISHELSNGTRFMCSGISARDYFAAAALSAYIQASLTLEDEAETARRCYAYADAMLAERSLNQ